MRDSVTVRPLLRADWPDVERIYADGIANGSATFETETPAWEEFDAGKLASHRFVAEAAGRIVGWVAAAPTSKRAAYAGVVEHSIYIDALSQGQGVGGCLLDALIASTESAGIWTISASVFPENTASLALHAKAGFRTVGTRERIAVYRGQWQDTVLIERRSPLEELN